MRVMVDEEEGLLKKMMERKGWMMICKLWNQVFLSKPKL